MTLPHLRAFQGVHCTMRFWLCEGGGRAVVGLSPQDAHKTWAALGPLSVPLDPAGGFQSLASRDFEREVK